MKTRFLILVAVLGLVLPCWHCRGDEPQSSTAIELPPLPPELSGEGDASVGGVQAGATPSQRQGQTGTAAPRPAASPGQVPPTSTTPTPPTPSPSPAAVPAASTAPAAPGTAGPTPSQSGLAAATAAAAADLELAAPGGFGELSSFGRGGDFQMIGDASSLQSIRPAALPPTPPPLPSPRKASSFVASVRGIKISENQSPAPQDRVFYSFNYFAEVNQALNKRFEASVDGLRVYREMVGIEKTFCDGDGSIGVRLPINTVSANSTITGNFAKLAGTSTAVGDLSFFAKYVFVRDPATGSLVSGGLAISTRNGPANFAGAKYLAALDATSIQPFVGYIWSRDRFYLHGFLAIDTPASLSLPIMVYNDVGIGYFVFKSSDPMDWLTAIAPTFEVHVNDPLTHNDWTNRNDPGAAPNVVNLTSGINFQFSHRSILTLGLVTPVTGPKPFDYEALILLNVFYGRTRRVMQVNPPVLGG
jgi:hypothetical protein